MLFYYIKKRLNKNLKYFILKNIYKSIFKLKKKNNINNIINYIYFLYKKAFYIIIYNNFN